MTRKPASSLLDNLRVQADAINARRVEQLELSREVVERVDKRLHSIFRYFDEACGLLQVVSPPIEREFVLADVASYSRMSFERGQATFRKQQFHQRDIYDHVVVYYSLTGPPPAPLRVASRRAAEVERALSSANIEFRSESDSGVRGAATYNIIHVAPGLRCEVRFDPDFVAERIVVTLRNVDRFEPILLDFEAGALDTAALDDLVKLMLGKPSQFLLRAPLRGFSR